MSFRLGQKISNMFSPIQVYAQLSNPETPQTYSDVVGIIVDILNLLIPILIGLALLLFIWGIVTFMTAQGSEESVRIAKQRMFWGIIAIFVMVSFLGIVEFFFKDIFGGPFFIPFLPE